MTATTDTYTLSGEELQYLTDCISTAKLYGWPVHLKIDTEGVRVKIGDETWSLPMGVNLDRSGVIELPDERH
jgi:hypothetical protein